MLPNDKFINADNIALELSAVDPDKAAFKAGRIMLNKIPDLAVNNTDFDF